MVFLKIMFFVELKKNENVVNFFLYIYMNIRIVLIVFLWYFFFYYNVKIIF